MGGGGSGGRQPTLMKAREEARGKLSRPTNTDRGKTEAELSNAGIVLGKSKLSLNECCCHVETGNETWLTLS